MIDQLQSNCFKPWSERQANEFKKHEVTITKTIIKHNFPNEYHSGYVQKTMND